MKTKYPLLAVVFLLAQGWALSSHAMDEKEGGTRQNDHNEPEIEFYSDEETDDAEPGFGLDNEVATSTKTSRHKPKVNLDRVVRKIRSAYKRQRRLDPRAAKALKTYIQPRASSRPISDVTDADQLARAGSLHKKVLDFLEAGDEPLIVVFGPAGAGKSSYGRFLEKTLWEKYDKGESELIPLFIQLTKFYYRKDRQPIIEEFLQEQIGLSFEEIRAIRGKADFVVVLDGYEELGKWDNLYEQEKMESWAPLTIITSRAEVLDDPKGEFLFNAGREQAVQWHMAPLVEQEIEAYIDRFVKSDLNRSNWTTKRYKEELTKLRRLLGDQGLPTHHPLALRVLLEAMPVLAQHHTGAAVYQEFVHRWLNEEALRVKQMISRRDGKLDVTAEEIRQRFYNYSQDLALAMFAAEVDVVSSRIDAETPHPTWGRFFDQKTRIEQEGSPIMRVGQFQYRFVGSAMQQYLVARRIVEEILHGKQPAQADADHEDDKEDDKENNDDEEQQVAVKTVAELLRELRADYLINQGMISGKPTLIRFLAETVSADRERLLPYFRELVTRYKSNPVFTVAVANALEILNAAGISFANEDLRGLCVAVQRLGGLGGLAGWHGPDLTGIDFCQANLDGADLRGTKLCQAKLNGASVCGGVKLDQADLQGASLADLKVDSQLTHDGVQGNFEKLTLEFLLHKEAVRLEQERLNQQITNLQTSVRQKDNEITRLNNENRVKQTTINGLSTRIWEKDSQISTLNTTITRKDKNISDLASDVSYEARKRADAESKAKRLDNKSDNFESEVNRLKNRQIKLTVTDQAGGTRTYYGDGHGKPWASGTMTRVEASFH
ncbi:MAG: pentapeptide repeat-containing protein [Myxococcota bacterium]